MKDERLIRRYARDIMQVMGEMKATPTTNSKMFTLLQRRLERASKLYLEAGGPDSMAAITAYGSGS